MHAPRGGRRLAGIVAVLGWPALGLQLVLTLQLATANGKSLAGGLIVYFSFFTILTNVLAALTVTLPPALPGSRAGRFFARPDVATGVAASIAIVGITYSVLLRHTWNPQGLQRVADIALHDLMPIAFLIWWWVAVPADRLRWSAAAAWALYPLVYFGYALAHGAQSGQYAYPFIDVGAVGYGRVVLNGLGILAVFLVVGLGLIAVGRWKGRRQAEAASASR